MLFIVFWHFRGTQYFEKGYLAVEFYFILSGYLLYKSYLRSNHLSAFQYTFNKIKRFFPEYFLALIISTALDLFSKLRNGFDINVPKYIFRFITEVSFVQNIGFFDGGANYPCWYLSVLIIGGFILWALLRIANGKIHCIIGALLSYSLYTLLFIKGESFEQWDLFYPLLRGIAGLSLGIVTAKISSDTNKDRAYTAVIGILYEAGLFSLCLFAIFSGKIPDIYMPFFFCLLILFAFKNSWSESIDERAKNYITILGSCTFGMLVFHSSISYCCTSLEKLTNIPVFITNIIYLVSLLFVSISVKNISRIAIKR